jgi:hypothetical protein
MMASNFVRNINATKIQCQPMCQPIATLPTEMTIAGGISKTHPFPAMVSLVHFVPKVLFSVVPHKDIILCH